MSWQNTADIAQLLETVFVAVSLIFIWRELRTSRQLARAANTRELVEAAAPFYLTIFGNRESAQLWLRGLEGDHTLQPDEWFQFRSILNWWINFYENVFTQHRDGLLHEDYYQAWLVPLRFLAAQPGFGRYWLEASASYSAQFQRLVDAARK
jgi:hypothetical protein